MEFRKGKGTRDAGFQLRMISEKKSDTGKNHKEEEKTIPMLRGLSKSI